MTELHDLICQNDYDRLEEDMKKGKHDVNARDEEWGYRHAIHWAAMKGFSECIRLLVEYGAKPYAKDYRGWTAAHFAAENGKTAACRVLYTLNCPLQQADKWGQTPCNVAVAYGHMDCALYLKQCENEIAAKREKFYNDKQKKKNNKNSKNSSKKDSATSVTSDKFEFDEDDPDWRTFVNICWGNSEFEGLQSSIYIPYMMSGA